MLTKIAMAAATTTTTTTIMMNDEPSLQNLPLLQ
jgi:hypothetical protein